MAGPSVTYSFSNSTTADATQVNQNFTDLINGMTDGTKDFSINALTCAGAATFNGNVTLGNATGDDITVTGSLASTVNIKTTYSYDIGSATIGLKRIYFGSNDSAARSVGVRAGVVTASYVLDLPPAVPAANNSVIEFTTAGLGTFRALVVPTVQKFTSGTAQTYTTPANVKWIHVRMVGGGGGGGGSGTTNGTAATDGGATTFGSSLLTANGGSKGARDADGGAGGTATVSAPAIQVAALPGGSGGGSSRSGTVRITGGHGGSSGYGGGGGGGSQGASGAGQVGSTNTGGGGGGAETGGGGASAINGSGGGAGGFVDAIITAPSATYTYSVGTAGSGQAAGTSGLAGGNGAAGYIEVTEYYQ